jgi:hypothetical protein
MAPSHIDEQPMRVTFADYKPPGQGDLEQWLAKEGGQLSEPGEEGEVPGDPHLYESPRKEQLDAGSYASAQKERQEAAEKAVPALTESAKAEQRLMAANFDSVNRGDFATRSVMLGSKSKAPLTLEERVRKLVG